MRTAAGDQRGGIVQIIVNGDSRTIATDAERAREVGVPARAALEGLGFDLQWVAVAVNGEAVPKSRLAETMLREGDEVEVLSPMAGG